MEYKLQRDWIYNMSSKFFHNKLRWVLSYTLQSKVCDTPCTQNRDIWCSLPPFSLPPPLFSIFFHPAKHLRCLTPPWCRTTMSFLLLLLMSGLMEDDGLWPLVPRRSPTIVALNHNERIHDATSCPLSLPPHPLWWKQHLRAALFAARRGGHRGGNAVRWPGVVAESWG